MIAALLLASWVDTKDGLQVENQGDAQAARTEDALRHAATVHLALAA